MFVRKFKKIAKKNFGFLLNYGFNERQDDFAALEQNLVFEKGCWTVSICYYVGLSEEFKRREIVDVIIEIRIERNGFDSPYVRLC